MENQSLEVIPPQRSMRDLWEEFKRVQLIGLRQTTLTLYESVFVQFSRFMAGRPVNRETYAEWIDHMARTSAPATVGNYRSRISKFLRYCMDTGVIPYNPDKTARRIKIPQPDRRKYYITKQEYELLKTHA